MRLSANMSFAQSEKAYEALIELMTAAVKKMAG